jgi:tetratricopeptide (TPR) repeat protein
VTESHDERYARAVENARAARAWQEDYEPGYSDDAPTLPEPPARSRQFWIVVFLVLSLVACVLGSVLVPGGMGFLAGYRQLQAQNHELAIQHFNRGLGFMAENYPQLAYTEFEIAVKFDGGYGPAQDKLRELQATIGGQETPGAQPEDRVAATLFGDAGTLIAKQDWSDAITRLEQLRTVKPDYHTSDVNAMLYKAYVADGQQAVSAGQIELARERFDAALAIQNGDAVIVHQRDLAVLYLEGQQSAGFNWQTAINKFAALYLQDPTYYDVKQRLVDAYTQYGELAFRQNAWCLAVKEYDGALAISQGASLGDQRAQAMALCKQAISATPTTAPVAGTESFLSSKPVVVDKPCDGNGDISGTVRDALARPMAGVEVEVGYYADGIDLTPARTNDAGQYQLILGKDPGMLHVVVLSEDGKTPAGLAVDLDYVGGNNAGCHVLIDWQRVQ